MVRATRLAAAALAVAALVTTAFTTAAPAAPAATTLTVYSGRSEIFVKPVVERFIKETGIQVKVRYGDTAALAATILEEGKNSPADLFFAQEAGALGAVANEGLLTKLPAATLARVPARFRSPNGLWVGTSGRARVVAYSTAALTPDQLPSSIYGFTHPRWKGKIGLPPTNASFQAFVTAVRLVAGEDRARDWLVAIKANDAKFFPNNLSVLQAIARGEIQVGFVNHYYLTQLKAQQPDAPVANYFLGKGDPGALVNVAGVGILKSSGQPAAAQRFVDFLLSQWTQRNFARGPGNAEYPLIRGVRPRPGLPKLAEIAGPDINLGRMGRELGRTLELLSELGYTR